ncbi:MAG: helix-turn-helix transcriptional regulator [Ruminococcaceae bacterium]|nr:helix-turn-helix transcriptional regulator [Oscillospiraceae bacterium]
MNPEQTGKLIAALRKEQSMTQKELAQRLGVSDKTVSKWETGRGLPDISVMPALCEILGISINELLSGARLDASAYQEKAEEHLTALMRRGRYKNVVLHLLISTLPILLSFLTLPFAAEQLIPPLLIPVVFFWCILWNVGNLIAGITYGIVKKWGWLRLLCISAYDLFLLSIQISYFAIAVVVITA